MELRVPVNSTQLSNLPTEVLGLICRSLRLNDRVRLSITCRSLRHSLASSEDAWGTLDFACHKSTESLISILPWLAQRRQGLRRLKLKFFTIPEAAVQLAACLEGSPLVQLELSSVQLSSDKGSAALQWLGSCAALTSLTLRRCCLSCLPGTLKQLSGLSQLSLAVNELGGASWGQLQHLTALTRLDISGCRLTTLPTELVALPALADLSLAQNKLEGVSWGLLQQLTALTRLDLSNCRMSALPAELAALPNLAQLDLAFNQNLGAAAEEAWDPLAQCFSLTSLGLGGISFPRLPPALAALAPHLVGLSLHHTWQSGLWAGGEATLGPLFKLSRLTRLDLYGSLGRNSLPEGLSCLVALQELDLGNTIILGEELALRPLRHLTALTRLDLSSCFLKDLPEELSHMQALKDLNCGGNQMDARVGITWQRLHRLTALTRLSLERCNLSQLPPELAELRSVADLNLSDNWFLGAGISESAAHGAARGGVEALRPLVRMTALQHLNLSGCCLPRELEVDAIPFPLHWLESWAEQQGSAGSQ